MSNNKRSSAAKSRPAKRSSSGKALTLSDILRNTAQKLADDKRLSAVILINVVFSFYFLLSCLHTGLYGDDYGYRYVFAVGRKLTDNRVDSLAEVISSQYAHYQLMNGRSVAHTLLQFTLIWDHRVFSILNTAAYCLLGIGLYLHSLSAEDRRTGRHRPLSQLIIYLIPWILFPDYGNIFHIESLAANYLWTMTIIIWYLYPFRRLFEGQNVFIKKNRPFFGTALMFITGAAAGWSSENGSAAALLLVGSMGLYYLIKKKPFPSWCLTGFLGALFGFIMMLTAPGYKIRVAERTEVRPAIDRLAAIVSGHTLMPYGCFIIILILCTCFLVYSDKRRSSEAAGTFSFLSSLFLLVVFALNLMFPGKIASAYINLVFCAATAAYLGYLIRRSGGMKLVAENCIPAAYTAAAFTANFVLVAVPYVQRRNQLPFLLLLSVPAAMLFESTISRLRDRMKIRVMKPIIITVLCVYSIFSLISVYGKTCSDYAQFTKMEQAIYESKANGVYDITVKSPELSGDRRTANLVMTNNDPDYWINQGFCQYYGINSVRYEAGYKN